MVILRQAADVLVNTVNTNQPLRHGGPCPVSAWEAWFGEYVGGARRLADRCGDTAESEAGKLTKDHWDNATASLESLHVACVDAIRKWVGNTGNETVQLSAWKRARAELIAQTQSFDASVDVLLKETFGPGYSCVEEWRGAEEGDEGEFPGVAAVNTIARVQAIYAELHAAVEGGRRTKLPIKLVRVISCNETIAHYLEPCGADQSFGPVGDSEWADSEARLCYKAMNPEMGSIVVGALSPDPAGYQQDGSTCTYFEAVSKLTAAAITEHDLPHDPLNSDDLLRTGQGGTVLYSPQAATVRASLPGTGTSLRASITDLTHPVVTTEASGLLGGGLGMESLLNINIGMCVYKGGKITDAPLGFNDGRRMFNSAHLAHKPYWNPGAVNKCISMMGRLSQAPRFGRRHIQIYGASLARTTHVYMCTYNAVFFCPFRHVLVDFSPFVELLFAMVDGACVASAEASGGSAVPQHVNCLIKTLSVGTAKGIGMHNDAAAELNYELRGMDAQAKDGNGPADGNNAVANPEVTTNKWIAKEHLVPYTVKCLGF